MVRSVPLLLEPPFQPPQKSWEIGNRPGYRVSSSGRPRTSDTNHPRGVTPLSDVDCSWYIIMFKVRKTKKKSSASGARGSPAAHTTEEPEDLQSVQDEGHDSDSQTSAGEGHVSTPANTELDGDAEADVYTPPQRPRLYAAAAPRPVSTREHHLQLAGRPYEMEMERVLNGKQEKLSDMATKYYNRLLEAAPSPVSVASPKTSSADETSSEASSRSSLNSTVSHTTLPVQESSSVVQMSDSVFQSSEGTDRTHSQPVSEVPIPTEGFARSTLTT